MSWLPWKFKIELGVLKLVMSKMNCKGSLLFETFIALMVLAVGITSTLKIFGEALFVGKQNEQRNLMEEQLNHLLFSWFADPQSIPFSEAGPLNIPFESANKKDKTMGQFNVSLLTAEPETDEENENKTKNAQLANQVQNKQMKYFKVDCNVLKNQHDVLDLSTIVFKLKKPNQL